MKLCLGTVQFGMDYGIRGQKKPSQAAAIDMLDYATQNGIDTLDTAFAYGTAEDVVGAFLARKTIDRSKLFISSKLKPNALDDIPPHCLKDAINQHLDASLLRLHTDYLDAYLFHSSRYVYNEALLNALDEIKQTGKILHCGVSVYYPDEAKQGIASEKVDFLQLPFSIFDQRMREEGIFDLANQQGRTRIHARSAFIQGLILMDDNEIPPFLHSARPILSKIDSLCSKYNISRIALALLYVKHAGTASHLVFGVDNREQLKENIRIFDGTLPGEILAEISETFSHIDADIMMPSLWVKH